jgi:plasmid maintenance system antidote protein VapI
VRHVTFNALLGHRFRVSNVRDLDMIAETAILLSRALKTSSEFWMNLQVAYDLYQASRRLTSAAWRRIREDQTRVS